MLICARLPLLLILTCGLFMALVNAEETDHEDETPEEKTESEAPVTKKTPKKVQKSDVPQPQPSLITPPVYPSYPLGWYAKAPWGWSRPQFNPFPNYIPPAYGGSTGYGNQATSCAYAYPNRRYTCYGLGR